MCVCVCVCACMCVYSPYFLVINMKSTIYPIYIYIYIYIFACICIHFTYILVCYFFVHQVSFVFLFKISIESLFPLTFSKYIIFGRSIICQVRVRLLLLVRSKSVLLAVHYVQKWWTLSINTQCSQRC